MQRRIQKAWLTLACSSLSTTVRAKRTTKALTQRVGAKPTGKENYWMLKYWYANIVGMDHVGRNSP